jgi:pyruvate dehydrogenase E1 component
MFQPANASDDIAILESIQRRLLWLATLTIHHANHGRPNPDGTKVGGHQASSASVVTILTALYFRFLRAGDRIAVKPHASPVFHSAMYLLGILPQRYLTTLRSFGGLQAYPSRTKDVDPVDFSTGSVGLGAVAPAFAALAQEYAQAHFGQTDAERFIALSGDAELDEGNVWEAIIEESLQNLRNTIWIIDLNRQSLDRVVPGVRAGRLKDIFAACGWQVLEAKYGLNLQAAFDRPGGDALRQCIDDMSNEQYQSLIRSDGQAIRQALSEYARGAEVVRAVADVPDAQLPELLANLGGHDLRVLLGALDQAAADPDRPAVIFAYTVKGWGLPIAGDPLNHSALLSPDRLEAFRQAQGIDEAHQWDAFAPDSPEGRWCAESAARLALSRPARPPAVSAAAIPRDLGASSLPVASTQEAFGRALLRLADAPVVGPRIVTSSPDVSVSTNLAGWINRVGTFHTRPTADYEAGRNRALHWQSNPRGRHIELGISEMNLFMLLGQLGLSHELNGQLLFPIGTVYDPFVCRGLDALIYGLYSASRFIFAGTPSGVSLSPEGGAHQSAVTASLGMELPNLDFCEPCFAVEVEWALLEALRQCCDREHGRSTYLRLSTRPVEQALLAPAIDRLGADPLRAHILAGGYRLREPSHRNPQAILVTCGAILPEALAAADYLEREGVGVSVINAVYPRRLFEDWQASRAADGTRPHHLETLIPAAERNAPVVTVHDAASHALAWVGSVFGQRAASLGVNRFGQSGTRQDVYRYMGIDADSIAAAVFAAVDG